MTRDYRNTAIVALAAVLLTLIVLMFLARNPWMLVGVAAVLWAIAAIVRAINGNPGTHRHPPSGTRGGETTTTDHEPARHDDPGQADDAG